MGQLRRPGAHDGKHRGRKRLDSYADWSREYRTATRIGCLLGLRVNIAKGFYADASARYEHGFDLKYIPQPNRVEAVLALGYKW